MSFFENLFADGKGRNTPTNFRFETPAFSLSSGQNGETVSTGISRKGSFAQSSADTRIPRIFGDIDALRGTIRPGFSDLRASRLGQVEAGRSRAVSNLRDSLSNRRIAGSSFAENQLLNAERTFAREAADVEAASFLEELAANTDLLNREFATISAGLEREFAEIGLAANVGTQLASLIQQGAQFDQQMAFNRQQQGAQLFSTLVGAAVSGGAQGGVFSSTNPTFPSIQPSSPSITRGGLN